MLQVEDRNTVGGSVGDESLHGVVHGEGSDVGVGLNESQVILVLSGELSSHIVVILFIISG